MSFGKQEIYRERTFGSYPTVQEIRRSDRRSERDSLLRLLRCSASHQSTTASAHNAPSNSCKRQTARGYSPATVDVLVVSHDAQVSNRRMPTFTERSSKLPPLNDLHLRPGPHPVKNTGSPRYEVVSKSMSATQDTLGKAENLNTHFRRSKSMVRRHFWINPEWLSEGLTVRRLQLENRADPMKFGWM